jgi:hypothetical protein
MAKDNIQTRENEKILALFYPENDIEKVKMQFQDPEKVFEHFYKKTNCWNCEDSEINGKCDYKKIEAIYLKTKEFKKSAAVNQLDCKKYFM